MGPRNWVWGVRKKEKINVFRLATEEMVASFNNMGNTQGEWDLRGKR